MVLASGEAWPWCDVLSTMYGSPWTLFFILVSLSSFSQRVTALSSDNGRQLKCHAKNPALFQPLESTMTMSVYCECLNLSLSFQSTPPHLKKKNQTKHILKYIHTRTHNKTGTQPQVGPRVTGLVRSFCVSCPRRNTQPEGKLTPASRQHECDCPQFTRLPLVGLDWYDQNQSMTLTMYMTMFTVVASRVKSYTNNAIQLVWFRCTILFSKIKMTYLRTYFPNIIQNT